MQNVERVASFRGCCQGEQFSRFYAREQVCIRGRGGVMKLVDYHDIEILETDGLTASTTQGLDACEYLSPVGRATTVDKELTETTVAKHLSILTQRLLQDLFAVGYKQQTQICAHFVAESAVIQRSNDCLTGTCGSDHEVAVLAMDYAGHIERLEDAFLVRIGLHVKAGHGNRFAARSRPTCLGEGSVESVRVLSGVVALKAPVVPVGVKRGLELAG
ncbi:Uncharacterised protein [Mycobacteroides abscessus subsp. abscessus]|nr:Uncharacterised protein [Mycobacteroides abscessus subsp. abscessus]